MIRLQVVEDEAPIRNGIIRHVPFAELGVDEVRSASSAEEALEIMSEYKPDIIISDIRMPGMGGIELCKTYKNKAKDCQIIFISGFSDKEYLTTAISLGAVNYIEKPIDIEELKKSIKKAVDAVVKINRQHKSLLHSVLTLPEEAIKDSLHQNGETEGFFTPILFTAKEGIVSLSSVAKGLTELLSEGTAKEYTALTDSLGGNVYCILLKSNESLGDINAKMIGEKLLSVRKNDEQWFVAIGTEMRGFTCPEPEELKKEIARLKKQLNSLSYLGWNKISTKDDEAVDKYVSLSDVELADFQKLINAGETESMIKRVNYWCNKLIQDRAAMNLSVKNSFYTLHNMIEKHYGSKTEDTIYEGSYVFIEEAKSVEEICDYICSYIKEIKTVKQNVSSNYIIKEVCNYINSHISKTDLSIVELSEIACLAPTYLSALFRKKTGNTISSYIQEMRLNKACELLKNPAYKQYEVAEMVGYDDAKYFAKAFKKKMGLTPSEYRDNMP